MTPLQKAQDVLVRQRSLAHNGVVSYGTTYPRGNTKFWFGAACMSGIYSVPTGKDAFLVWHGGKSGDDLNKRYLDYILSPTESPWRDLIRAQPQQDGEFIRRYGYVLTDFNHPGNYFVNFLTAWRLSEEKPHCTLFWSDLVRDGVRPGTALMYTSRVTQYNQKGLLGWMSDTGHNAFSLYYADLETPRRVNSGQPDKSRMSKTTFKDSHSYTPCNIIWGKTAPKMQPEGGYKLGDLEIKFQDFLQNKAGISRTKFSYETQRNVTYELIRDFCLELDKETKETL